MSASAPSAVSCIIERPRVGPSYRALAPSSECVFQVYQIVMRDLDPPLLDPLDAALPEPFSREWASNASDTLTSVRDNFFKKNSMPGDDRLQLSAIVAHRIEQGDAMPPPNGSCVSVWMFGRSESGHSVAARVTGWRPSVVLFVPEMAESARLADWVQKVEQVTGLARHDLSVSVRMERRSRASRYEAADAPASSLERKMRRTMYLSFPTMQSASMLSYLLRNEEVYNQRFNDAASLSFSEVELVERKVSHVSRFCVEHHMAPSDWVSVSVSSCTRVRAPHEPRRTWRQYELELDHMAFSPVNRGELIAPFTVFSHDIETFSNNDQMPDEMRSPFPIINYNAHAWSYGVSEPSDPAHSYRGGIVLSRTELPEDSLRMLRDEMRVDPILVPTERDLLDKATALMIECHADITLGFNTTKYDNGYMAARAGRKPDVAALRSFWMRSAFLLDVADVDEIKPPRNSRAKKPAASNAHTHTQQSRRKNMYLFATAGSFDIDAIMHARAHKKMTQYDMNTVASESGVSMSKVKLHLPGAVRNATRCMLDALQSLLRLVHHALQDEQEASRLEAPFSAVLDACEGLAEVAELREVQEGIAHDQPAPAPPTQRKRAPDRDQSLDMHELLEAACDEEEEEEEVDGDGEEEEQQGDEDASYSDPLSVSAGVSVPVCIGARIASLSARVRSVPAPAYSLDGLEERFTALHFNPTRPTERLENALTHLSRSIDDVVRGKSEDWVQAMWLPLLRALHQDRSHLTSCTPGDEVAVPFAASVATVARSYLQTKFLDARAFLGNNNYRKLFALHRLGPVGRALNCVYCAVDVEMPLRIMVALTIIPFTREQSSIARVQMSDVGQRGQQHKGYNKLFATAYNHVSRFVLDDPYLPVPESQVPYPGGAVQDPIPGLYGRSVTLDFAQLYPSIMQAFNLGPDTMLPSRPGAETEALVARLRRDARAAHASGTAPARLRQQALVVAKPHFAVSQRSFLPVRDHGLPTEAEACRSVEEWGAVRVLDRSDASVISDLADVVEFHMLDGELKGSASKATGRLPVAVVQHVKSITTTVLEELTAARKRAKLELKSVSDEDPRYDVLDARQLALKLLANALYGFFGVASDKALYACMIVSATVCLVGRNSINSCAKRVDRLYRDPVQLTETVNAWYRDVKRMPHEQVQFLGDARDVVCTLYGDTDSIMVGLPGFSGEDALKLGLYLRDDVNALFPPPMVTELEKLQQPVWFSDKKKCYAFMKRVPDDNNRPKPGKIETKGLDTVRRDRATAARETQLAILKILLEGEPPVQRDDFERWKRAKFVHMYNVVRDVYVQMAQNLLPLSKYVRTMQLAEYADAIPRPHVSVVQLLQARGAMDRYEVGDRVPFVHCVPAASGGTCMVTKGARRNLVGARILDSAASHTDHPTWMLATGENVPDRLFYGGQILYNPVVKVLGPLCADGFPSLDPLLSWFRSEVNLQLNRQATLDGARAQRLELSFDQRRALVGASFSLRKEAPTYEQATAGATASEHDQDRKRARAPATQTNMRSFFRSSA